MSERHIVLWVGRKDNYSPADAPRGRLTFTLDGKGDNTRTEIQQHHLWDRLADAAS